MTKISGAITHVMSILCNRRGQVSLYPFYKNLTKNSVVFFVILFI